ncbi:unnamed protein product, partial [Polarella glacialis]
MAYRRQETQQQAQQEGELFVPFSVLPAQGVVQDAALGIRLRSVDGLPNIGIPRLSIGCRIGPLLAGPGNRLDKSKEVSVKCQLELVKQPSGAWVPESSGGGGTVRIVLPPSLLAMASKGGISCRLKVCALSTPLRSSCVFVRFCFCC